MFALRLAWQKDFYDHIIRETEDYGGQVRYLLRNPVQRGCANDGKIGNTKVCSGKHGKSCWRQSLRCEAQRRDPGF
jgi:hypothetical protein